MKHYIILFKLTEKGQQHIQNAPKRVEQAKELFVKFGATIKDFYFVTGQYDTVLIVQAPDDKTTMRCVFALSSLGNVYSETLCAFTQDELKECCSNWPDLSKYSIE